jgi:CheY-like chemotaxis protein
MPSWPLYRGLLTKTARESGHAGVPAHCVLVVDDDSGIRGVLRDILEGAGYVVDAAADGEIALRLLQGSEHPYVVLLDLWMPNRDGLDVLAEVAADLTLRRRHAFALVTADPRASQRLDQRLVGALRVPIIAKPFDLDELLDIVEVLVRELEERCQAGSGMDDTWHRQRRMMETDF